MTANDLDPDDPGGARHGDVVLVTDASAEGETIAAALRARGFVVIDVPLGLLESRVAGELPDALVVDIDEPGAHEAVDRVRERPAGAAAEVVCVGDPIRAAELGIAVAFERPVDVAALVAHLARVARPLEIERRRAPTQPPSSVPRREHRRSAPPSRRSIPPSVEAPAPSDWQRYAPSLPAPLPSFAGVAVAPEDEGPRSDPLDLASIASGVGDGGDVAPDDLSPDLAALLAAAEQRVAGGGPSPSSFPAPIGEADVVVPSEMLSLLDEPLDDDEGGTGGTGGVGAGTRGGTHAPAVTGATHDVPAEPDPSRRPRRSSAPAPAEGSAAGGTTSPARTDAHTAPTVGADEPVDVGTGGGARAGAHASVTRTATTFTPDGDAPGDEASAVLDRSRSTRPPAADAEPPPEPAPPPFDARAWLPPPPDAPPPPLPGRRTERMALTMPRPPTVRWPGLTPAPAHAASSVPAAPAPANAWPAPHGAAGTPAPGAVALPGSTSPAPTPPPPAAQGLPAVLGEGDALRALARAIAARASGSLALSADAGPRRVVLRDGDVVTAGSGVADETLVAFLAARGDLDRDVAARLASKLPPFGRHAGAALVANGHLGQDDLWPVLRAHAEWIIGRALVEPRGTCELEDDPPGRLKAEPSVFGGATGAEVLVETVRRVIAPADALDRLGGAGARLEEGARAGLLGECALPTHEAEAARGAPGRTVGDALAGHEPELANVLYALTALGVLDAHAEPRRPAGKAKGDADPLDEEALRQRVRVRMELVEDGDYFALLGVPRTATSYEIRRSYLALRRGFEPGRVLTAATADLADDLHLLLEVLDEAYEILREPARRDRYRRAIEVGPP